MRAGSCVRSCESRSVCRRDGSDAHKHYPPLTAEEPAREAQILAALKGTPSEREDPRGILVNKPDYVVFVPRQPRDPRLRDPKKPGDTYNDHFQVIEDKRRGLLYAFWTQASREGAIDQHIAFSKSADRGRTWTEPVILAGSPNKANPGLLASWQQPMLAKTGRLYCLWNLSVTNSKVQSFGACWGAYSDDGGETWSRPQSTPLKQMVYDAIAGAPDWINWQRPLRLGEGGRFLVGCSRTGKAPWNRAWGTRTEFWQFENIDDNPEIPDIRISMFATNRLALTTADVEKIPGTFKDSQMAAEEAAIVKLPDGRLFAVMRSSVGSPVCSRARKQYALVTCHDATFTFVPSAKGAFAAARRFRDVSGYEPGPGVGTLLGRICLDQWWGTDYDRLAADVARAAKYGVRDAVFVKHDWQRWGYDFRLPDVFPPRGCVRRSSRTASSSTSSPRSRRLTTTTARARSTPRRGRSGSGPRRPAVFCD